MPAKRRRSHHLILGISITDSPRGEVWSFDDDGPQERLIELDLPALPVATDERPLGMIISKCINAFYAEAVRQTGGVSAVGIALPGNIDRDRKVIRNIARLGLMNRNAWLSATRRHELTIDLRVACEVDVLWTVDNDITCLALGNYRAFPPPA